MGQLLEIKKEKQSPDQLRVENKEKASLYEYLEPTPPCDNGFVSSSVDDKKYYPLFDLLLRMNDEEAKQLDILLQKTRELLIQKAKFYRLK